MALASTIKTGVQFILFDKKGMIHQGDDEIIDLKDLTGEDIYEAIPFMECIRNQCQKLTQGQVLRYQDIDGDALGAPSQTIDVEIRCQEYGMFVLILKAQHSANLTGQADQADERDPADAAPKASLSRNKPRDHSLTYARSIQQSMMTSEDTLSKVFPDSFEWNMPRDYVSGDFLWMKSVGPHQLIAVCDCTGHGVPGALLSILGTTLLNQIDFDQVPLRPAAILEDLRTKLILSVNASDEEEVKSSGMDMSLCVWNPETRTLSFAGAYHPLMVIQGDELKIFKGTKSPVGGHLKNYAFEEHDIQLATGDAVYLYTDGITDQCGINRERYRIRRLSSLIYQIRDLPMVAQKERIQYELECWQAGQLQTDDMLMVGFRV